MEQKPSAQSVIASDATLPDEFPKLPADVLKRFPSLNEWETQVQRLWNDMRESQRRQRADDAEALTKKFETVTPAP